MNRQATSALQEAVAPFTCPMSAVFSEDVSEDIRQALQSKWEDIEFGDDYDVTTELPTVFLITARDIRQPSEKLMSQVKRAIPGRPVLIGGLDDRDTLLEAINTWHVWRMLPDGSDVEVIGDAIHKAAEAMQVQYALEHAAGALHDESHKLHDALKKLEATQQQLLHSERLNTLGRITSGMIPAMGRHLTALESLEERGRPAAKELDLERLMDLASQGVRSIRALLEDIKGYTEQKPEHYAFEREPLDELVERVVAFGKFDSMGRSRHVLGEYNANVFVQADRYRLHQAMLNLLRNAFQATEPGDKVEIRSYVKDSKACIEIQDHGEGMSEEVRQRLFEPFFTTKGAGMGLGLQMTLRSIESHRGTIECESTPGEGTTFRILLPVA